MLGSIPFLCSFDNLKKQLLDHSKELILDTYKFTSSQELVEAVRKSDYELVKQLLNERENIESRELKEYKTLAHISCHNKNFKMLKILIDYGCCLESLDYESMTPIFEAIYSGDISLCDFLIEDIKININHTDCQNRNLLYW